MIEFDPEKDRASRHGLPFALAAEIFDGYYVEEVDDRFDYGETRVVAIGCVVSLDGMICSTVLRGADRIGVSSAFGEQVTGNAEHTVVVTPDVLEEAHRRVTPEVLARLKALTDVEISAMIAADPDAAPELDDAWFARARSVRPFKDAAE